MSFLTRKKVLGLVAVLMIMTLAICGCGKKAEESEASPNEGTETTEDANATDDASDNGEVEEVIEPDAEDVIKQDIPLQIERITLYKDGSIEIIPTEDLKKNAEDNKELKDGAMHPFEEFGKAKKIYLVRFGNGGYRTLIALMEDGTLAAMSAKELIEDHIAVVMPNMTGRDTYVDVKQVENEDSFGVMGVLDDGEEVELDFSLNF